MHQSFVYILTNFTRSVLYIGVTNNLVRRLTEHRLSKNSNCFTARYNVIYLLYFEKFDDITQAIKREKKLKEWPSQWKWNLIKKLNPNLIFLDFNSPQMPCTGY
jgi:putative endonuclease